MFCPPGEKYDALLGGCRKCFSNEPCYQSPFGTPGVGGGSSDSNGGGGRRFLDGLGEFALDLAPGLLENLFNREDRVPQVPQIPQPTQPTPETNNTPIIVAAVIVVISIIVTLILVKK